MLKIMVVDDNVDLADTVGMLLRMAGQEVRTAYDGRSALKIADSFCPNITLLDIGMPDMDGYQVIRQLREADRGAQPMMCVAMTGWGQPSDERRSREAGFDHHLVKPVEPAALWRLLEEYGRSRSAEADAPKS